MSDNTQDFFLPPALVARALASLAEQCHDEIRRLDKQPHQGSPDIKSEKTFYLKQYRAFIRAAYHWGRGVRPDATPTGGWLVPSGTRAGLIHEVCKHGGVWVCGPSCEARDGFHWHTALAFAIETAIDLADAEDDGDDEPVDYLTYEPDSDVNDEPFPTELTAHGRRLALARAAQELRAA